MHKPKIDDFTYGWIGLIMTLLVCIGLMMLGVGFFRGIVEDWATDSILVTTTLNCVFGSIFCGIPVLVIYAMCFYKEKDIG